MNDQFLKFKILDIFSKYLIQKKVIYIINKIMFIDKSIK